MLPTLANYFGISVDELIGMEKIAKEERYDSVNTEWTQNNAEGKHTENVQLMREALKIFPNDALLLVQLSTSLEKLSGTKQEKRQHLKESIAVQEQILRYGEDGEVRSATMFNICFAYEKAGEHQKAVEQALKLPNFYKTRENALVCLLEGGEKQKIARDALTRLAWSVRHHLASLAEAEQKSEYLDRAGQISKLLDVEYEI